VTQDTDWIAEGANAAQKYGAELVSCPATSVYTAPGFEIGGALTETNSVRDSGTFTCTQPGGPGTPVTISIANADTTAYTVPSTSYYPNGAALPADTGYVVAGRIDFAIPYDAVLDLGVSSGDGVADLTWDNAFTDFAPTAVDGTLNDATANLAFNDHRRLTSNIRTRGSWSKAFIGEPNNPGNTPPSQFRPGWQVWEGPTNTTTYRSGDGILLPGQVVMSGISMHNQSSADQDVSFVVCDNWDNNKLRLKPDFYPGSTIARHQQIPSDGDAVWFSGYSDAAGYRSTRASVPTTLNVEYGTGAFGTPETCEDGDSPTGWETDPNLVTGGLAAISKVRIHASIPANTDTLGTYTTVSIALEALGTDPSTGLINPVGTVLPNYASGKTLFGTHTQAQVLANPVAWATGTYVADTNNGTQGDRMIMGSAAARLSKEVWDNAAGAWVTSVPAYTSDNDVNYRLLPTLTSGFPTEVAQPVSVEDCLPLNQSFVTGSATPAPTVVQLGSPAGALLSCPADQIYLRWDLGALPVGDPIDPITYTGHVASTAPSGTMTNNALVTAEGDPSEVADRAASAQIQIIAPAGVAIDKTALTPQSDINRAGETNLDPLLWAVSFRNLDSPSSLSDVDAIDLLPVDGVSGTSFNGTVEFSSATVTAGTGITILYSSTPSASINQDANDASNSAGGSTVWCDGPTAGAVVSGAGTPADCPATPAEVTALRLLRPGAFLPGDLFDIEIAMIPEGNLEGDIYVNQVTGRATGLLEPVGPVARPEVIVSAELGDLVFRDLNGNGLQDLGEPGVDGVTVSLWGIDDDGNPVASAGAPLTTVTAGGGLYEFDELPAGTYNVLFDDAILAGNELWTMANNPASDLVDSDGDVLTGLASGIVVSINQSRMDVDQGIVTPALDLVKYVNTEDANTAPGETIETESTVTFDYVVSNTGALEITDIALTDDILGAIVCPATSLEAGDSMTCTITDVADEGPYVNIGTVTGQPTYPDGSTAGSPLEATDPANYFGGNPSMTVVKFVNGVDADTAPGELIAAGDDAVFTYEITNTGNLLLDDVALVDDILGAVSCPATDLPVGESMTCSVTAPATAGPYVNIGSVTAQPIGADGTDHGDPLEEEDPANYFGTDPAISIVKFVNGADANTPPGETVAVGDDAVFTYELANTGNLDIADVSLTDDILGPITCPATTLAVGETMTCTITAPATGGAYVNIGTVTGQPQAPDGSGDYGVPLEESDPANYFGGDPSMTIVKSVNGEDANTAPGAFIAVGDDAVFTYDITNTGNLTIDNISLIDDVLGPITCPATSLAADASMTCTATAAATAGPYTNTGTVTGQPMGADGTPHGDPLEEDDPANYFGTDPGMSIVKYVNGEDANAPLGAPVSVGDPVTFDYVITNTGNLDIYDVALTDDILGPVECPATVLEVGETMTCTIVDVAVGGPYVNIGTVTGQPQAPDGSGDYGDPLEESDPANYFGSEPSIEVEKYVNGVDADGTLGLNVTEGDEITFTYVVTNTGNVALHDIAVLDDILGPVTCPATSLEPGEAMTCTFVTTADSGTVTNIATATARTDPRYCPPGALDATGSCTEVLVSVSVSGSDPATYTASPAVIAFTGSESRHVVTFAFALIVLGLGVLLGRRQLTVGVGRSEGDLHS
jgi:hypothetical protein